MLVKGLSVIPTDILSLGNVFIRQDGPGTMGQKESKCKAPGVRPDTLGSVRACVAGVQGRQERNKQQALELGAET